MPLVPLNETREAVWAVISETDLGTGVTLAAEGAAAPMPYVSVGSAYKGGGKPGTLFPPGPVEVVVQVDAFASSTQGGAHKVGQMLRAVDEAIQGLQVTANDATSQPLTPTVEDDVLNPVMQDTFDGPTYAQRYVRYRFIIT